MSESITKELRDCIFDCPHLTGVADRIDAEMVKLPLSADGHIWTGREECFWTSSEQEGYNRFGCVALRNGKWHVEDNEGMDYEAESVWYERPDSLERIADEIDESDVDGCTDWADRIRRLAEREDER